MGKRAIQPTNNDHLDLREGFHKIRTVKRRPDQ